MSSIYGKVVSVEIDVDIKKKDSDTTYKAFQIVYRTEKGEIRDFTKPIGQLKFKPESEKVLRMLKPGDEVTISTKKEGQFVNLESIQMGSNEHVPVSDVAAQLAKPQGPQATYTKPTYETPEERAFKQRCIVAQSSISASINHLGSSAALDEILSTADDIYDYVMNRANDNSSKN